MTDHPDLTQAVALTASVVQDIGEDQLALATPCARYTVRDVLVHVSGLAAAFTAAAAKDLGPLTDTAPGDVSTQPLSADWPAEIPAGLTALAQAWQDPAAWQGFTRAGGLDLPGEIAGVVALNEVVLHGWDLAVVIGRADSYDPDDATLAVVHEFLRQSRTEDVPAELFGPAVDVPADAPLLHQVLGLAGRDPAWRPA